MKDEDAEIQEETELQRRVKKIIKTAMALFLIFLMLNFLIPSDIAGSLIEGKKIVNYRIDLGNKTITFEPSVYQDLKLFYFKNQLTELKVCLAGSINNNSYKIESFYIPRIFYQTPISVSSESCSKETIISLHTHPFKNCLLSYQDILSHEKLKQSNPYIISGVMCDIDRFAFYNQ